MPDRPIGGAALVGALALLASACGGHASQANPPPGTAQSLALTRVASGLTSPVYLTSPPGDARQFVVEQPGRIRVIRNGQLLATPYLDLTAKVRFVGEQGLLSVAFDPAFATNGRFFVYYNVVSNGDIAVEQYTASPTADVAQPAATPVLSIPHSTFSNHNGGLLMFGPDGMLFVGVGDGGSEGDPSGNGQNLGVLLGKLLRLDVHALPYSVPASNPFLGQPGKRGEIWAYGLRNPWRYAFDRAAAGGPLLFIADVGQDNFEEIDRVSAAEAGVDYGWNKMEGAHCYPPGSACDQTGLRLPIVEYDHSKGGCAITGGFVYRGASIPEAQGQYFYSDFCAGILSSVDAASAAPVPRTWGVPSAGNVTSFGEDAAGELYLLTADGSVYRISRP